MPAIMEQIGRMSIEEREKLANWILEGIRNGEVVNAPIQHAYRTIVSDPSLKGEILCDIFEDDSESCHKDPADRMIIALALESNLPVVTADKNFPLYGVKTIY